MKPLWKRLLPRSLESRLAVLALALGAVAVFGAPGGGETVTINPRELARIVETEADHLTAQDLADAIIQGRADLRLIDLRPADRYAEYHIPGAENVALTDLLDYPLYRNERIVLYSNGGIHSAQAWFLLQAKGFRGSYILLGGLEAWKNEILFPIAPLEASAAEIVEFRHASAVSAYFGGSPQSAASADAAIAPAALPQVEAPAAPPPMVSRKRKAREGC